MAKKHPVTTHILNTLLRFGLGIMHMIALLPPCMKKGIGWALRTLLIYYPSSLKRVATTNIALCFPALSSTEQQVLYHQNISHLVTVLMDLLNLVWPARHSPLPSIRAIRGLEHLEAALNRQQGVLLLFPHLISIYLVGYLLIDRLPFSFSLMYNSPKNAVLKTFFDTEIKKHCSPVFTRQETHAMLQYLREGHVIWYAPDLEPKLRHAVFAPFFNRPAATYATTARIAQLSGAVSIPIAFYRDEHTREYDVVFEAPLTDFPSGDPVQDATHLNLTMEKIIRKKPAQYLWLYKRYSRDEQGNKTDYYRVKK